MILLLTGPVHSGKSTLLDQLVHALRSRGIEMDGFLNRAVIEEERIIGYDLVPVKGKKAVPFLRDGGKTTWQKTGPYFLIPEGLAEAERIIARSAGAGLLVVDEVGPLELKGKGLWPALKQVLYPPAIPCLLVVREKLLGELRGRLEADAAVFDVRSEGSLDGMISTIGGKGECR